MIARAGVLVDANVIIDIATDNPRWQPWSAQALADAADRAELWINPVILAEVAPSFATAAELDAFLPATTFRREDLPWEAAFEAGWAYVRYRRAGGARRSPIADFYIGAHAAARGYALLTREAARFRTYFPSVPLITP